MGNRGGAMNKGSQADHILERKRREASDKLSAMTPMGAFTDDPTAENYDKNGRVVRGTNSNLITSPWDLGQYPPNE